MNKILKVMHQKILNLPVSLSMAREWLRGRAYWISVLVLQKQISVAATMGHFLSEFLVQRCFLVGGKFQGLVSSEYYSVNTLC